MVDPPAVATARSPAPHESMVEGIDWPALPAVQTMNLRALQYMLDRTQWWPAERLRQHQFRQLHILLDHALRTVPYYRDRLKDCARPKGGQAFTPQYWLTLPRLMRSTIQEIGQSGLIDSDRTPPGHGSVIETSTSGSTGMPITTRQTDLTQMFFQAANIRESRWHRRDLTGKLGVIRRERKRELVSAEGRHFDSWGVPHASIYPTGPSSRLDIFLDVEQQASWLIREQLDYLQTLPSALFALARYAQEHKVRLPCLKEVVLFGEVVPPELRALCREVWGVKLVDVYSSQETGIIALQCPEHEHYHAQSETVLVEVIDEDGRNCQPGQVGRVVLTPLHNFAMPLIRYEIGDFAEVGKACPCGRGLPVLRRILGRARNMLTLPNGEKRFSILPVSIFGKVPAVLQHQTVQKSLDEIEVRLVVQRPLETQEEETIRQGFLWQLKHRFRVRLSYVAAIAKSPEGKYEEFRSEI